MTLFSINKWFRSKKRILVLQGPPGTGKTHAIEHMTIPSVIYRLRIPEKNETSYDKALRMFIANSLNMSKESVLVLDGALTNQVPDPIMNARKVIITTQSSNPFSFLPPKKEMEMVMMNFPDREEVATYLKEQRIDRQLTKEILSKAQNWWEITRSVQMESLSLLDAARDYKDALKIVGRGDNPPKGFNVQEMFLTQLDGNINSPASLRLIAFAAGINDARPLVFTENKEGKKPWSLNVRPGKRR